MKTGKLVIGIISCVLFAIIIFQSCAAGVVEAIEGTEGTSAGAGTLSGLLILSAGIIAIATRELPSGKGTIVAIIMYGIAGLLSLTMHGFYKDLIIWGILSLVFAVVFVLFQTKGGSSNLRE